MNMKKKLSRFLLIFVCIVLSIPIFSWATKEENSPLANANPIEQNSVVDKVAITHSENAAYDIPFYENWEDEATWSEWSTRDNNLDGTTWAYQTNYGGFDNSKCAYYRYSSIDGDDWLFSPALNLASDKEYSISFWVNNIYVTQKMKITFGSSKDPSSQTSVIIDLPSIDGTNRLHSTTFRVPADGVYYIGFYVYTPGGEYSCLYLDNIKIEEAVKLGVPANVESLTQIPGANGEVSMGLSWTNPTKTYGDEDLTSISAINIYKDRATTPIVYNTDLTLGKNVTWTDPNPTEGSHTYKVTAVNNIGESYSEIVNTYVGVDVPKGPTDLTLTSSARQGILSWTAPSAFGNNGGWYDPTNLSYRIVRNPDNMVLETSFSGTSYTDTTITSRANYSYTLTSKNSYGTGGSSESNNLIIGSAVQLPFYEDWENANTFGLWTIKNENNDEGTWERRTTRGNEFPSCIAYESFSGTYVPADDWLFTPSITLEKDATYRIKFKAKTLIFTYESLHITIGKAASVAAHKNNVIRSWEEFTTGWNFNQFLANFTVEATSSYSLGFHINSSSGNNLYIDDISIEKVLDKDIKAVSLTNNNTAPTVNDETTTIVSIINNGTQQNASGFTVQLIDDDDLVLASSRITRPLAAGVSSDISLKWTPVKAGNMNVRGRIVYDDDQAKTNNDTKAYNIDVQTSNVKVAVIGTEKVISQYIPINVYGYSFSESVYYAKDMQGYIGDIESIAYKVQSGASHLKDKPFKIWMGEVDEISLNAGWISATRLQLVFDGSFDIPQGTYDLKIPLQNKYTYKGGNLAILIDSESEFGQTGEYGLTFFTSEYGGSATMYLNGYYDNNAETPNNAVGHFSATIPNTMLYVNTENTGKLSGYVYKADGITPLSGAAVKVEGMNNSKKTDANGYYEFPYVISGSKDVTASIIGYAENSQEVNISLGQSASQNFTLSDLPKIVVSGKVVGQDNPSLGIGNAKVSLSKYTDYSTTTDASGNFSLPDVWGGQAYDLNISYDGYADYVSTFTANSTDHNLGAIALTERADQPLSVTAIDQDDNALVLWDKPVSPKWITKDDGVNAGYFGSNNTSQYSVAHRYTPENLKALGIGDKLYVTKVKFYPASVATYTIKVWAGQTGSEVEVYSEEVTPEVDTWFEYALSTPVKIDVSQNIVIGYQIVQNPYAHPAGFDKGPAVENGDVFFDGTRWTTAREATSGSMNYNWNIQAFCSASPNSSPVQLSLDNAATSVEPKLDNENVTTSLKGKSSDSLTADQDSLFVTEDNKFSFKLINTKQGKGTANLSETKKEPLGYSVWRLINGEEADEDKWVALTPSAQADTFLVDNGWKPLGNNVYRYAVKAVYSNSTLSEATFSNGVDKGKYATVKVGVTTNTPDSGEGATVTLKNSEYEYSGVVQSDGYALISNVYFGNYSISIEKEGFDVFTQDDISVNENSVEVGSFELKETTRPPKNAKAVDYINQTVINWESPGVDKSKWIGKDNGINNGSIGYIYGGTMVVGHRFTSDDLKAQEVVGFSIDKIKIFPYTTGTYTLKVWRGTAGAEMQVYAQNITVSAEKQWTEATLSEPIEIVDNQSYIIGYEVTHAQGLYPCGYDFGPTVSGGDLIKVDNLWYSFSEMTENQYSFNWNIQTFCTNSGDVTKSLKLSKEYDVKQELPSTSSDLKSFDASLFGHSVSNINETKSVKKTLAESVPESYKVWRLASEDKDLPENWTLLTPTAIADTTFTDTTWDGIENKNYYYAVRAKYTGENYSNPIFTNELQKGTVSIVTINATTNNNRTAESATVTLKSSNNSYSGNIGSDGSVAIVEVKKAIYTLSIEKDGYETITENVEVANDLTSFNTFTLSELKQAPVNASVQIIDVNNVTKIDWNSPGSYVPQEGWVYWDDSTPYTGLGNSQGSIVFDAAHAYTVEDINALKIRGLSVSKVSFYVNNNPELAPTVAQYTVKVWKGDTPTLVYSQVVESVDLNAWNEITLDEPVYISGDEPIYIGYNCNLTSGFAASVDDGPAIANRGNLMCDNNVWTTLLDLTGYDVNWVIHAYCSNVEGNETRVLTSPSDASNYVENKEPLSLSASNVISPDKTVSHKKIKTDNEKLYSGYKLWRFAHTDKDNEALWTLLTSDVITDTTYTDNTWQGIAAGTYQYAVKAVYASGNSDAAFTGTINDDGSGIDSATDKYIRVYPNPSNGLFNIQLDRSAEVRIVNILGQEVYSASLTTGINGVQLNVPAGSYFVRIKSDRGESVVKILIQ